MALESWTLTSNEHTFPIGPNKYRESTEQSGQAQFTDTNSSATKVYWVDWSNQSFFLDALMGYSYLTGSVLHRVLPFEHPDYVHYYAIQASVRPWGGRTDVLGDRSEWPLAVITVTFAPVPYRILSDEAILPTGYGLSTVPSASGPDETLRYIERVSQPKADYVTIPGYNYKFCTTLNPDGTRVQVATNPGFVQPSRVLKVTWYQIPGPVDDPYKPPLDDKFDSYVGKVNSVKFLGYEPGTVLFTEPEPKMTSPKFSDGSIFWNLTYTFEIRNYGFNTTFNEQMGHNYIFSAIKGAYDLITTTGDASGTRLYRSADLNDLFRFSAYGLGTTP